MFSRIKAPPDLYIEATTTVLVLWGDNSLLRRNFSARARGLALLAKRCHCENFSTIELIINWYNIISSRVVYISSVVAILNEPPLYFHFPYVHVDNGSSRLSHNCILLWKHNFAFIFTFCPFIVAVCQLEKWHFHFSCYLLRYTFGLNYQKVKRVLFGSCVCLGTVFLRGCPNRCQIIRSSDPKPWNFTFS